MLLGGCGVVVGGHVVDKAFGASLDEVAKWLDHKVGKEVVGGQNHGSRGCFPLLPALTMVRMKLHWELNFELFKSHQQLACYSSG